MPDPDDPTAAADEDIATGEAADSTASSAASSTAPAPDGDGELIDRGLPLGWMAVYAVLFVIGLAGTLAGHEFVNLRVIFGLLLVLFIPGYLLIAIMFPRTGELDEEFDGLYRITLGMAMSICIVILVGFILGNPGLGYAPEVTLLDREFSPDPDIDGDGIYNNEDDDADGDGLPNEREQVFELAITDYEQYLHSGMVHANLTRAFTDEEYLLSDSATLFEKNSHKWTLIDGMREFILENNSNQLEIFANDLDDDNDGIHDVDDDDPQGLVKGYFQVVFITPVLLTICLLLLWAGWYRGAYLWAGVLHPKLARAPPGIALEAELAVAGKEISADLIELHGLHHERKNLRRRLESLERRERVGSKAMQAYYARQRKRIMADLADVDARVAELEGAV